ncbi:hypothetical protein FBZ94_10276 [Bradyrhizobium sacchari]|uniref:Uncharacterized protein n=1 Tax=Bradyrhizobium sacchari TaxID=1399419 RepID=A0A560KCY0_9BRAD|nr:hypothetical protein FBZ94_10276 [Bradyrhizobium sacchari]TWB80859.1 hypothetical protein FBZ95_10276 [Bradyrhizobium sacchari]
MLKSLQLMFARTPLHIRQILMGFRDSINHQG